MMVMPRQAIVWMCVVIAGTWVGACWADDPPPGDGKYVTREEYEALKKELVELKRELAASKAQPVPAPAPSAATPTAAQAPRKVEERPPADSEETTKRLDEVEDRLDSLKSALADLKVGTSDFVITGAMSAGYTDRHKEDATFGASFSPIFLWKVTDRIFVEAEPEFELEGDASKVHLEFANASFIVNDYLTVRGGLFLTPFGQFPERLHPVWINKLPDNPLVYREEGGLVPFSSLGFEARGAVPIKSAKLNYAVYVANGPGLVSDDEKDVGTLKFDNFTDNNNSKAVGGRIGFLPVPGLEAGYSIQAARVNGHGFSDVNALLQGVDLSYLWDSEAVAGTIDFRAEWVWSDVSDATYDPAGTLGFGPLRFNNKRNGGYFQLAYRPSKIDNKILKNVEFICRYDMLNGPSAVPNGTDDQRVTLGIDYWLTPSTVFKTAYQIDDREHGGSQNAFFFQTAIGF